MPFDKMQMAKWASIRLLITLRVYKGARQMLSLDW